MIALAIGVLWRATLFAADIPAATPALTNIVSILNLSVERASSELPVQLTAAVTYVDPAGGILFVEDGTGGIFVGTRHTVPYLRRGELVEIRGRTDAGLNLPAISQAVVQPAGRMQALKAAPAPFHEVVSGRFDCQFIELRGVVRQVGENRGRVSLIIDTEEGLPIEASFLGLTRTNLWDATVRVRGVCGLRGMKNGRILSVILYCWSNEALTIEKPGRTDPFAAPLQSFADLRTNRSAQRVLIEGRVTSLAARGMATIQDDANQTLEIETQVSALIHTNDRVQISTVPAFANGQLTLRHIELRAMAPMRSMDTNATATATLAPLITRVADIRKLGEAANAGYPVRLRGTVTYYDRAWLLFVQDDTGGIYIYPEGKEFDLQPGQWVEVEGFTHPGDYAPIIYSARFTVIDQVTLPTAKILLPEILFRGQHDSQRVDVSGVVYSVTTGKWDTAQIELGTSAGRVTTSLLLDGTNLPTHLVDAEVRVRGVCGSTFNQRRQFTGPLLFVASTNDIIVDRAAPADPFAIETQPISTLLQFGSTWMHRAKVSGAVTFIGKHENILCVEDKTGGVFVRAETPAGLKIGDAVEAVGFPTTAGYTPSLLAAAVRAGTINPQPVPKEISAAEALSGTHDGKLVSMKARLLDRFVRGSNEVLVLKEGNVSFEAQKPHDPKNLWWKRLEARSTVQITGVCVVQVNASSDPHAFQILLRSPSDVTVLRPPAFWNDRRVLTVSLWATAILLITVFWVALLRRKVSEQTAIIREQLSREQLQNDDLERKVRDRTTALSQANAQLQEARDELEGRVQERTAELSRANETLREEILERQRSEQALRLSEERFSKAFRCSPVPMAISTMSDGRYIDLNDAYAEMLGYAREEMLGRTSIELAVWDDLDDRMRAVQTMRDKKRICDWRLKLQSKSGDARHVLASAEIIVVNNVDCLLAIVNDETERVVLEDQLRQSQKMEAVGQLAAGIAHDFNNMLTIIKGHVCLMLASSPDTLHAESLTEISHTADRAANLTRQLLTFSRRQPILPRLLDINEVIAGMSQMLRRTLGEQIVLQFRRAPLLPTVQADQAMIEQLLLNLAVNARDAMPNGGQLTFATARQSISEDYLRSHPDMHVGEFVCITVSDTGCGMDAKTLSRAFEPFFTTKDVGKGTGLGLASVYGSVKQHGGWIELRSEVNHGTTFKIYFPVKEGVAAPQKNEPTAPVVRGGKETILLVEDENGVRELARNILHRYGYNVVCAEDGMEAMELWREQGERIDLLLTDMVMPSGLSGRELASQLQGDRPELKVIYSSGYSMELEQHGLELEDGLNFIPKPYAAQKLASVVRSCLDN